MVTDAGGPSAAGAMLRRLGECVAKVALAVLLVAAAGPVAAAGAASAAPTPVPVPEQAPDAAAGLELFAARCSECHGELGRGDGRLVGGLPSAPRSFTLPAVTRLQSPAEAFDVISRGRLAQGMPPWRDALTLQERWDVLYGAWSFHLTPDRLARAMVVWEEFCSACHVAAAASVAAAGADAPSAGAWPPSDHLARSQQEWFHAVREPGLHHSALDELADDAVWLALDAGRAATFRTLPFADLVAGAVIRGRVVNGTTRSGPAAGAVVHAVPLTGAGPGEPATTRVGAAGTFELSDLVSGAGLSYRVVTTYAGADYVLGHPVSAAPDGETDSFLELTVYEAAADVPVQVRTGHLVLEPRPELGAVLVTEVWVIVNETDRTRVAGEAGGLRFELPETAFDLVIEDARTRSAATVEGRTLIDRLPVPPGEREIVLRYHLPYWGRQLRLLRTIDLPTRSLQVLVPVETATIESPLLATMRAVAIEERTVVAAIGADLEPGTPLVVDVGGLPRSAPRPGAAPGVVLPLRQRAIGLDRLAAWGVLVAAAGTLLSLAFPLVHRGRRRASGRQNAYADVVRCIAALDRRHARGRVAGDRYTRERGKLLERAMRLAPDTEELED